MACAVDQRGQKEVNVLLADAKQERHSLEQNVQKVVSVDNLLKSMFAVLQIIVIGLQGWMLTTILEHGDRVTKLEVRQQVTIERNQELHTTLREILAKQTKMLEEFSVVKSDIERMKADLKSMHSSPK